MTMGGQYNLIARLISGYDPVVPEMIRGLLGATNAQMEHLMTQMRGLQLPPPLQVMPLQDCVDLAIFMIRTTINAQQLSLGVRGTGGHIDVATITRRDGLQFVQQKKILGER